MVDAKSKKCRTEGCGKGAFFGVADSKTMEYCAQHAPGGMINVRSRKCRSSTSGAGTKIRENCAQHEPDGMINVRNRKCRTEGCVKRALFGVAGTKITEYCAQHAPELMIDIKNRK